MNHLTEYIECKSSAERMELLAKIKISGKILPISLAEDVLWLQIPTQEKIGLLDVTDSRNRLALEHFLLSGLPHWEQDLAAFALRKWVSSTDHLLWYRLLAHAASSHITQRIQYTILDQCSPFCGSSLISAFQNRPGLNDLSPAFHALIFQRSAQHNLACPALDALAKQYLEGLKHSPYPDIKAIPAAIGWLMRFDSTYIKSLLFEPSISDLWREVVKALYTNWFDGTKAGEILDKILSSKSKTKNIKNVIEFWPSLWTRSELKAETLAKAICTFVDQSDEVQNALFPDNSLWRFFAGTNINTLGQALELLESDQLFAKAVNILSPLVGIPIDRTILDIILKRLAKSSAPGEFLQLLNLRLRLNIANANKTSESIYSSVFAEEQQTLNADKQMTTLAFLDESTEWQSVQPDLNDRKLFFDVAYRKIPRDGFTGKSFWQRLGAEWNSPQEPSLKELASAARKAPELFKLCYIQTLGRYKGVDTSALKLLDFVRSSEESEMIAVINSLASIGTSRCYQELISSITRPNTSMSLKLEICNHLKDAKLESLQSELRSAINDLNPTNIVSPEVHELMDSLSSLLIPRTAIMVIASDGLPVSTGSSRDLDVVLAGKIPHYNKLSSEVKRALRTAQFFHDQIGAAKNVATIDLSPVIDMQYKALELLFRESFENSCSNIINDGILQRKLDVLGYARPIPRAMDEFEKYIGLIPVIETIPYFSKFKLRKMLRGICQYRPGKRFTLDGIKAFALFFVCFGRTTCRFGLENVIQLGFKDDASLCEFGKSLHIFQDFRNRAAHEGFHPEAHNDINGIWQSTAEIIQTVFQIREVFQASAKIGHFGASKSVPIIERKESSRKAS